MTVVALDIGGTKTLAAYCSSIHVFPETIVREPTPQCPETALELFKQMIEEACSGRPCQAIGVSAGGPLDHALGTVSSLNLPLWENLPIASYLTQHFSCPVTVEVDTDAAVLAEYKLSYPDKENIFFMTVSTGIGGGLIHRGSIFRGFNGAHPEVGHQQIEIGISPIKCNCGADNCLEALASGTALKKRFHVDQVQDLSESAWLEFSTILGQALRNIAHLYAPEIISVGGGVALNAPTWVHENVERYLREQVFIVPCPTYVKSSLGYEACLRGAAILGFQCLIAGAAKTKALDFPSKC
jgi:predicted NBD/HSP70 family sugar kinase